MFGYSVYADQNCESTPTSGAGLDTYYPPTPKTDDITPQALKNVVVNPPPSQDNTYCVVATVIGVDGAVQRSSKVLVHYKDGQYTSITPNNPPNMTLNVGQ